MRFAAVVATAALALGACSSGSGNSASDGQSARPSTSPPTAPAPTSTDAPATSRGPAPTTTGAAPADLGTRLALRPVASGLHSPVAIAFRSGDPRMYVAEQSGTVRAIASGRVVPAPLLKVGVSNGNEQGLLGLTFSPGGSKLYVDYTDPAGDTHVVEYTMRGNTVDRSSARELLSQQQPYPNHNGGEVMFGPDGMLYIGLGDGGSAGDPRGNGQNLGTLLGKILRIDPNAAGSAPYSVPSDNPFVGRSGARTEIWMYGLRNPWRFSFDRTTHDVWIGDVGQNAYEEVDVARAGEAGVNWGWNAREGLHRYSNTSAPGARDPILETSHADGNCAVIGGYVYRGAAIPRLRGVYVFGDECRAPLVGLVPATKQSRDLNVSVPNLTSFGEDASGELYALSREGTVYRLTAG